MVTRWDKFCLCFCLTPCAFLARRPSLPSVSKSCELLPQPRRRRQPPLLCSGLFDEGGGGDNDGQPETSLADCGSRTDAIFGGHGTTSLLVGVRDVECSRLQTFITRWLRNYVSGAGPLPVPVSIEGDRLFFYGSDGGVRGKLQIEVLSVLDEHAKENCEMRVSSASRFLNRGGSNSASLPGERGVVRALFRATLAEFGEDLVSLLYKPAHIRLGAHGRSRGRRAGANGGQRSSGFGVVMIVRVRGSDISRVAGYVERWGGGVFSGDASFFMSDGIMHEVLQNGDVVVRCGRGGGEVLLRVKRRASGAAAFGGAERGDDGVIVTALTNAPDESTVRRVLDQLAGDLRSSFVDCRIHYPR